MDPVYSAHCHEWRVRPAGQGDVPEGMRATWSSLLRKSLSATCISGLYYAVFGLGDSGYVQFNVVAKKLDRRLEQLGGTRLIDKGLGDDQVIMMPSLQLQSCTSQSLHLTLAFTADRTPGATRQRWTLGRSSCSRRFPSCIPQQATSVRAQCRWSSPSSLSESQVQLPQLAVRADSTNSTEAARPLARTPAATSTRSTLMRRRAGHQRALRCCRRLHRACSLTMHVCSSSRLARQTRETQTEPRRHQRRCEALRALSGRR
jgi:sulfite reductase alpha subunit-like flavoprotein